MRIKIGEFMFGNIKAFSVYGLFGVQDVHLTFEDNIKILIGENGLGKTHILNLFYYTLTKNFLRLGDFNFERLELKFASSKNDLIIKKVDIDKFQIEDYSPSILKIINDLGMSYLKKIRNKIIREDNYFSPSLFDREMRSNIKLRKYDRSDIVGLLRRLSDIEKHINSIYEKSRKMIDKYMNGFDIIYFPTYRRVEEDLYNLGVSDRELNEYDEENPFFREINDDENLIQFGMNDVKNQFTHLENRIDQLLKEGLTQFTNNFLSMVIDNKASSVSEHFLDTISEKDIDIILARMGSSLSDKQKIAVKNVVAKKQKSSPLLLDLLQKLIDSYNKQKEYDEAIKYFRDICNDYLIGKEIFYDEANIKILVRNTKNYEEVPLSKLSSGEKQIVSIFSKIYLSDNKEKFIILFDEPELSLSVSWQEKLLPNICDSKSCAALFAVTHSPFIFGNKLDRYASNLKDYFSN